MLTNNSSLKCLLLNGIIKHANVSFIYIIFIENQLEDAGCHFLEQILVGNSFLTQLHVDSILEKKSDA